MYNIANINIIYQHLYSYFAALNVKMTTDISRHNNKITNNWY